MSKTVAYIISSGDALVIGNTGQTKANWMIDACHDWCLPCESLRPGTLTRAWQAHLSRSVLTFASVQMLALAVAGLHEADVTQIVLEE